MLPLVPLVVLRGLIGPKAGKAARGKKISIDSACRLGPSQVFFLFLCCFLFVVVQGVSTGASGGP